MSLAFVFPGQGSQSVGMLTALAEQFPVVTQTYELASQVLNYDLWDVVQNGPVEKLNQTDVTQPAMLCAGVAVWRVWQEKQGPQPTVLAGHSLGEYTALVCAGVLELKDAVALVADRGRFMQEAVPAGEGAMAAIIGLEDAQVIKACEDSTQDEVVQAVNFNSPGQVVIAGNTAAVERAVEACKSAGAKRALVLPVSVPSHCQLMEPAAHYLAERLRNISFNSAAIAVINNVDVSVSNEADEVKDALVRQLCNPVRWVDTVNKMAADGVDTIVECGPGKVLMGLNKRINRKVNNFSVFSPESIDEAIVALG
ncbi:MAG: ACP S-malonyltransferase [Gammaproteobacteria bacterium]|nr:ACP S-malonyltransferase [Gammaproteobacteria bacterium]MDH5799372.1 ACP S-malonyltransferase [Gammaproteobacteria bacterium]